MGIKGQNIEALMNVLDSGCGKEGRERKSEMFLRMIPKFMKFQSINQKIETLQEDSQHS